MTFEQTNETHSHRSVLIYYHTMRSAQGVAGLLGNTITIIALIKYERLRHGPHYFVGSLAVFDILASLLVPIAAIAGFTEDETVLASICPIKASLYILSASGNVISITLIAVDRFIAVFFALRYHSVMTKWRIKLLIFGCWFAWRILLSSCL